MPTTFARTMASSVRGWRSMMPHTVRVRTTAPTMARTLMTRAAGLRHPSSVSGRAADGGPGTAGGLMPAFGSGAVGGGGAGRSSMASSVVEEHEPRGHGPQDHHADIDQRRGPEMGIEAEPDEELADDDGSGEAEKDAHHPGREIGAEDVDRRRAHSRRPATRRQQGGQ